MAYAKKTTATTKEAVETKETEVKETVEKAETVEKTETKKTVEKVYTGNDLIPCRSVTEGELICQPGKDKDTYTWAGYGDVTEVTYDDLMSLRAKKSAFIFEPYFIIEDEDLLATNRWKQVREFYESMYSNDDMNEIIDLPLTQFKTVVNNLPNGLKNALVTAIATQLEKGTFDSLQKLKYVDEVCGSDLSILIN